jgi:hypothetical protein
MTTEDDDKIPLLGDDEYRGREGHRRRAKQRLLTAPHASDDILDYSERHGKVHQVQFKITPLAAKVGEQTAALFNLSLSQYSKAVLYHNLGLTSEPLDRRCKPKRKKRQLERDDEGEDS